MLFCRVNFLTIYVQHCLGYVRHLPYILCSRIFVINIPAFIPTAPAIAQAMARPPSTERISAALTDLISISPFYLVFNILPRWFAQYGIVAMCRSSLHTIIKKCTFRKSLRSFANIQKRIDIQKNMQYDKTIKRSKLIFSKVHFYKLRIVLFN